MRKSQHMHCRDKRRFSVQEIKYTPIQKVTFRFLTMTSIATTLVHENTHNSKNSAPFCHLEIASVIVWKKNVVKMI